MRVSLMIFAALFAIGSCQDQVVSIAGYVTGNGDPRGNYQTSGHISLLQSSSQSTAWQGQSASLQTPRGDHAFGVFNDGQVIVAGGRTSGGTTDTPTAETYILGAASTQAIAPLPTARSVQQTAAVFGDRIFVLTRLNGGAYNQFTFYNRVTNLWAQPSTTLSSDRVGSTAVAYDHLLYLFDGTFAGGAVTKFDTTTGSYTATDVAIRPTYNKVAQSKAVRLGQYIYLIGGGFVNPSTVLNTVVRFDPYTNTFASVASLNVPRQSAAATVANGKIYVVGGQTDTAPTTSSYEVYDPSTNTWTLYDSGNIYSDAPNGILGAGLVSVPSAPANRQVLIENFSNLACTTFAGTFNYYTLNQCSYLNSVYHIKIVPSSSYTSFTLNFFTNAQCSGTPSGNPTVQSNQCSSSLGAYFVVSFVEAPFSG